MKPGTGMMEDDGRMNAARKDETPGTIRLKELGSGNSLQTDKHREDHNDAVSTEYSTLHSRYIQTLSQIIILLSRYYCIRQIILLTT